MTIGHWRSFTLCAALTVAGMMAAPEDAGARNRLAAQVQQELLSHAPVSYALFERVVRQDVRIDAAIDNVVYLKLDKAVLAALRSSQDPLIRFTLPVDASGKEEAFTLNRFHILDDGFTVYERGADGVKHTVSVPAGSFYRGTLARDDNSLAAFTFAGEVAAVFSTPDAGNYNLVLNYMDPGAQQENYLLFRESDIRQQRTTGCGVSDAMERIRGLHEDVTALKGTFSTCNKLRISMNGDYRLYQRKGNSTVNSVTYLTSLFNVISAMYANEGISMVMSEAEVDTAPMGYTYGGSDEVLLRFGELTQTNFNGDIAHLVSGYHQNGFPPLGGLAWLDVLCQPPTQFQDPELGTVWFGPYSMADNYVVNNIPDLPVYSWDVNASAHEIGHNIGSPHTQSCSWPGGPIDNCVAVEDGPCNPGPAPVNGGTIMSYCHLAQGVGINFALGFGPLPGVLIREKVAGAPCASGFAPTQTLTTASLTRTANRQCTDGDWTYYYYDNGTASEADDELLLLLNSNGQNIGNVDTAGVQVQMTTQAYGSNTGRDVSAPYAPGGWKEINRSWKVSLPSQPTAAVGVRFPFTNQDFNDIRGSFPALANAGSLNVVSFKNAAAAAAPATATTADVSFYTAAATADATHWRLGSTAGYQYAEFISPSGVFGGSMGIGATTGIGKVGGYRNLDIYPNPAGRELYVPVPAMPGRGCVVEIFDQLGRSVLRREQPGIVNGIVALEVSALTPGVYGVRYTGEGAVYSALFVKK